MALAIDEEERSLEVRDSFQARQVLPRPLEQFALHVTVAITILKDLDNLDNLQQFQ